MFQFEPVSLLRFGIDDLSLGTNAPSHGFTLELDLHETRIAPPFERCDQSLKRVELATAQCDGLPRDGVFGRHPVFLHKVPDPLLATRVEKAGIREDARLFRPG